MDFRAAFATFKLPIFQNHLSSCTTSIANHHYRFIFSAMASSTSQPIALDLSPRSDMFVNVLLTHTVSLDVEDNIYVLRIGDSNDKVSVLC